MERTIHQTVNPCKPGCKGETKTCFKTCPAYLAWKDYEKKKSTEQKTYWVKGFHKEENKA